MNKYCVNCGEALSEEALFCENCGYQIHQDNNNQPLLNQYQNNQQQLNQYQNNQQQLNQPQIQQPQIQQQLNQPQIQQPQSQQQFNQPQNTYYHNVKRKKPYKLLFLLIPIAILVGFYIYYLNRSTPEKTIHTFVDSYNNLDADGMLDCIEPKGQALYRGATALLSGLTGYNVNDVMEGVFSSVDIFSDNKSKPHINIKIISISYVSDTQANAKVDCSYSDGIEKSDSSEVIPMIKVDGKWYLSMSGPYMDTSLEKKDTSGDKKDNSNSEDNTIKDNSDDGNNSDNINSKEDADYDNDDAISDGETEDIPVSDDNESDKIVDNSIIQKVIDSSELAPQSDDNGRCDYVGKNALDGKSRTAWAEGVDGFGEGEWLQLEFNGVYTVKGIEISNGYKKSKELYLNNGRLSKVRIGFSDSSYEDFELADVYKGNIHLDFTKKHKTSFVKIQILSVYKGNKFQDTCITDLAIY